MNFKVLNKKFNQVTSEEFLKIILEQRGVEDVQHLLNVSEKDLCEAMKFNNIREGLNLFDYWVSQDDCHIHIIFDIDMDGNSSGCFMYDYIKKVNKNINVTISMNDGKKHGIIPKYIPNIDSIDLLIVPDAGSSDILEQIKLNKKGIDILILDHHEFKTIEELSKEEREKLEKDIANIPVEDCKKEEGQTIIINNQDGSYDNKTLCGVGVCYKFCKEYDKGLGLNYADKGLDLVSIGLIGDCMDLRNYETRYLVNKGLENINNELIKEILYKTRVWNKEEEDNKRVTIEDIGWKIAPQFNGTIREGSQEDRTQMLKALIGEKQEFEYQPKRKKKPKKHIRVSYKKRLTMKFFKIEKKRKKYFNARKKAYDLLINPKPPVQILTLQQEASRNMYNVKSRQTKKINNYMEQLDKRIQETLNEKDKIIIIDSSDVIEENTYTGLVANKIASKYRRPCLVLKKSNEMFGGSGRNYYLNEIEDLKSDLEELKLFTKLAGHPNSFGLGIEMDKIEEAKEIFNRKHKDMKIEDTYLCDFEILTSKLKYNDVLEIARLKPLWGGDITEPKFVLPNITVKSEQISRHTNNKWNIIELPIASGKKIKVYQTQNAGEEGYNKLLMREKRQGFNKPPKILKMDLVVKMKMWDIDKDKQFPYLELVDYNVTKGSSRRF